MKKIEKDQMIGLLEQNIGAVVSALLYEQASMSVGGTVYSTEDWDCMPQDSAFFLAKFNGDGNGNPFLEHGVTIIGKSSEISEQQQREEMLQAWKEAQQEAGAHEQVTLDIFFMEQNQIELSPPRVLPKKGKLIMNDRQNELWRFFLDAEKRAKFLVRHESSWVGLGYKEYQKSGRGLTMILVKTSGRGRLRASNIVWSAMYYDLELWDQFESVFPESQFLSAKEKIKTYDPESSLVVAIWVIEAGEIMILPVMPSEPPREIAAGVMDQIGDRFRDKMLEKFPEVFNTIYASELQEKHEELSRKGFFLNPQ